jgi:hypothetical protein
MADWAGEMCGVFARFEMSLRSGTAMDPPLDSCEHDKRMRDGAVLLGRRVAVAIAAALCLSSVVGVLGSHGAEAAPQSKSSVTVTVSVSPPTEVYGVLNQVFSVTVAPPAAGDVSPTGVVTVSDLEVDLCPPITLPAPGLGAVTVICADTTVPIPVNSSTIAEYSYSGDENYLAAKSRVSGAVTAADATTSVIASSATGIWGSEQSLVFAATVADSQSGSVGVPTGEVSVEQGADVLCSITLSNGAGTCSPAATALSPGIDPITASYGGDPNFNASPLSSPISLTISPAPLVVTGDDAAMAYGSPLPTLGSTVSGFENGQTLATSGVTGQPQCSTAATTTSPVGAYPITCTAGSLASPDYTFGFAPGTLTVSQATTVISLKSLTATVSSEFSGAPTGSVTFVVASGTYSCDLSSQTAGSGSCAASVSPNIPPGNYAVSATYSGDTNFIGSSSSGELTVQGTVAPSTGNSGTGSGTGAGTTSSPGGAGGTNPTTSENAVSLASQASSALTYEEDVSVAQQNQAQQENQVYLRNFIAALLQRQADAKPRRTESALGGGTSGSPGGNVSLQGAKSTDGPNATTGSSAATSSGSSTSRDDTSLVVSKSGPLVPALILALVLGLCLVTAIEVRRRSRRAAAVSGGEDDAPVSNED